MRVLVAEDDPVGRKVLTSRLEGLGFEVTSVDDGAGAWEILQRRDAPPIAVLDWMMPEIDGLEVCRRVSARTDGPPVYILILTARSEKADLVEALAAGADDYVTKPFDPAELAARLRVGERVVQLQRSLAERVEELEATLAEVRELRSLLPICSYCKQIRNDQEYWGSMEEYLAERSDVRFSHSICPDCYSEHWEAELGPEEA